MKSESWEVEHTETEMTIRLFEEVSGRRCEIFIHTCPKPVHVDASDEGREQARRSLMGRCARMLRLEKLGAPEFILGKEEELVAKAIAAMRPRDVAQAMHEFPSFVARVERMMKEVEAEHPHDPQLDDSLLDPDTPIEDVDRELRELGVDPEELAVRGVAFVATLLCASCGAKKPHVHTSACEGEYRCETRDRAIRCTKWTGHFAKKNPHVLG